MSVIDTFLKSPTLGDLIKMKKDHILEVGLKLELDVRRSMRKTQLIKVVAEDMVDNDIFDKSVLDDLASDLPEISKAQIELEKLKIEAQIELARINQETRFKELEEERTRREKERNNFDLTKHIRLVPAFNEEDVDKYFQHFEKIASNLEWPIEAWPTLLQTVLKGKAQDTYASLSITDSANYDTVKRAILRSYEMVPEAYRQRFRDYRMGENQTYVEFIRQKETYLDRWIAAKGIVTDYNKLRQLILIEEFKWCVHDNVKTFLNERQVDTGYEMATLADEYTLTHQRNQNKSEDPSEYRRSAKPRITTSTSSRARLGQTTYLHRPSSPNNKRTTPHSLIPRHMEGGRNLTCYYCRKTGHLAANCYARRSAEHKNGSLNKPHGFISSHKESNKRTESRIREEYKPFISNGYVHPVDDATKRVEIKILRDTRATQSLMVRDDMPRESETATGERVVIQGVGGNVVCVPLYQISLDSEIVCGTVIVGVVDSLPMQGISMLLGNDLAGERVVPHPRMVEKLSVSEETEKIEREHPETLLPRVVTRAEAKRTEDPTTKMESEENEIIYLSQTCLSHEIGLNPMLEQTPSSNPNPREKIIDVAPVTEKSIAVEQKEDDQIAPLFEKSLLEEEPNKVPSEYFIEDDILTSTSAGKIMKSLTNFFSMVALPKIVQSDQGSNFTSRVFRQTMNSLGIKTVTSSAYHPQSQGALERFHSTLKTMIRASCLDHQKDWDEGIPLLMFAARDAPQESLGFSPFELIVGHTVRGPLSMLKEKWLQGNPVNESLLEYVSRFQTRLQETEET